MSDDTMRTDALVNDPASDDTAVNDPASDDTAVNDPASDDTVAGEAAARDVLPEAAQPEAAQDALAEDTAPASPDEWLPEDTQADGPTDGPTDGPADTISVDPDVLDDVEDRSEVSDDDGQVPLAQHVDVDEVVADVTADDMTMVPADADMTAPADASADASVAAGADTGPDTGLDARRSDGVETGPDGDDSDSTTADQAADGEQAVDEAADGEQAVDSTTAADEAADEAAIEEIEEDDPWTRPGEWYVVHTQSGYEKKVTANLHSRIESMNMEESIFEVVIPMEEVDEFRNGRKQTVQRKVFPGYLLVRCRMDDESWYCIRNTPGVTGFVGQSRPGQKPTPLSRRDVRNFLSAKATDPELQARRKPKLEYDVGDSVRVREGPFADFSGEIAEINTDHLKMKVLVNIFGRETLVEMDFGQVAKL